MAVMVSMRAPRMGLPEARAMVRWKRTSWMRYSWGSVEGGVHLGDLFGELGDVLVGGALGGERRRRWLR